MPLYVADGSIDHTTLQTVPEKFVIFYSSIVDGQMWCPVSEFIIILLDTVYTVTDNLLLQDCRAVDQLVKETFSEEGPAAIIVYVGNKAQ